MSIIHVLQNEKVPEHIKTTIDNYVQKGYEPGSFTRAVLANDLAGAIGQADHISLAHIKPIVQYVYNEVPSVCTGSYEKVNKWKGMDKYLEEKQTS